MKNYFKAAVLALAVAGTGIAFADRNGSGTYTLPAGNPINPRTTISSTWANNTLSDISAALSASIAKDGQTVPTANLPMGGFKHTGVANATARNSYAAAGQVQDFSLQRLGSVAGTNAITGNLTPAITGYTPGMVFNFEPANANTGATTLAINGLAAHGVLKADGDALVAGDLVANVPAFVIHDSGSFWYLLNPQSAILSNGVAISDLARLSQSNTFSGIQTIGPTPASAYLRAVAPVGTNSATYQEWFRTNGSTRRGYLGYPANGSDTLSLVNEEAGSFIGLTAPAGILLNGVNSSDFARKTTSNTFTVAQRISDASNPFLALDRGATSGFFESVTGTLRLYAGAGDAVAMYSNNGAHNLSLGSAGGASVDGSALFTTANDGSASGLDADFLDGLSSASFAATSHVHSAADITSGTLVVARGGTGTTTSTGTGNAVLSASPTLTGTTTAATVAATTVTVGGQNVCLANGTNCPAAIGETSTTATATVTGCTTAPTTTVRLTKTGSIVYGSIDNVNCTSNATTFTLTGALPAGYQAARFMRSCTLSVMDNSSTTPGCIEVSAASSTLTLTRGDGASFNASAVAKGLPVGKDGAFFFHLN